jgi:hypothetical protein
MRRRGIRVIDLEDFMCRCGSTAFEHRQVDGQPVEMSCRNCGARYSVRKLEKRTWVSNLPMSFGFRSLYWNRIETSGAGIQGIREEGYELRELGGPGPSSTDRQEES